MKRRTINGNVFNTNNRETLVCKPIADSSYEFYDKDGVFFRINILEISGVCVKVGIRANKNISVLRNGAKKRGHLHAVSSVKPGFLVLSMALSRPGEVKKSSVLSVDKISNDHIRDNLITLSFIHNDDGSIGINIDLWGGGNVKASPMRLGEKLLHFKYKREDEKYGFIESESVIYHNKTEDNLTLVTEERENITHDTFNVSFLAAIISNLESLEGFTIEYKDEKLLESLNIDAGNIPQ